MDAPTQTVYDAEVEAFVGQLMATYTGAMLTYMIDIGHRTGLFPELATGPATCDEIAARSGLTERYVREWLAAMVTGGIVEHDPAERTYWLPPARAAALTDGPMNLAPMAQFQTHLAKHVHRVARAFREGGGVPYAEYQPEFTEVMDTAFRGLYDAFLLDAWLDAIPGVRERMEAGARVADVACGSGHALVLLARAFPASTFVGYDLDDVAIARARAEAGGAGLTNVTYEIQDVATFAPRQPFDIVLTFDAIHDQVDPAAVLGRVHDALVPGGVYILKEPHAADELVANLGNPMATILYATSTLHCLPVSLAHDGAGIGTMFGEGLARQMLATAGFVDVEVLEAPGDPADAIYVSRRAGG
jgi:SAM-dependent methyltransferase